MKFLIVFALITFVVAGPAKLNDEQKAKVKEYSTACAEQEKITKEQVEAFHHGDFTQVDDKAKCYANCIFEKIGVLANGELNPDGLNAKLAPIVGEEKVKGAIEKCNTIKGTNNCDTAYQLYKCFRENNAAIH